MLSQDDKSAKFLADLPVPYHGPIWYAATDGTAGGDGSYAAPWPLATLLTNPFGRIQPGDTVYLRGGTYTTDVDVTLAGTSGNPITIQPYPGETAIINGRVRVYGSDTTWTGLIFTYTGWTTRQSAYDGFTPADLPWDKTLTIRGARTKIINCVMHDLVECELWDDAPDSELYGNVIYNNGFQQATQGGAGHCLYTQNVDGSTMTIHNNMWVSAYNFGFHAYGSSTSHIDNYDVRRNIHMSVRFLVGGNSAVVPAGIVVTDNAFYNSTVQLGYNETIADDVTIHDNYIAAARLQVGPHQTVDIQGNTVAATADVVILKGDIPAGTWDLNTYYSDNTGTPHYPFSREGISYYTFAQWQAATGFDAATSYTASLPTTNVIKVYANSCGGAHLGSVAIYNWQGLATVNVDLSSLGLTIGQAYKLRNAQNYLAEWQAFTYTGSPVAVAMTGWTVAVPIAAAAALYPSTFPTFGAFVVTP